MFENLGHFFKRMVKAEQQKELGSKDAAKERLHLVLMQDRANVSADFLELMKQEIIDVIKKYIVVDEKAIDVRLTNQANEDGTNGAPSLYANIPIVNIKNDMMAEKVKEFEGVDFNKEMGIPPMQEKLENVSTIENEVVNQENYVVQEETLSITTAESQIDNTIMPTDADTNDEIEMFEEVYDDEDDDDVTFDDLLKAAEEADENNAQVIEKNETKEEESIEETNNSKRGRKGNSKKNIKRSKKSNN